MKDLSMKTGQPISSPEGPETATTSTASPILLIDRPHFAGLDAIRGLAALSVVFYHLTWLNPTDSLTYVHNSYLMVDVFFVLSGFVIFYAYQGKVNTLGSVRRFLWLRFWRLYPIHFFFLMAAVFIESIKFVLELRGMQVNHPAFIDNNISAFLKNMFLVQSLHTSSKLTFNVPSWSISTEFCAYLLFAGLAFFARTKTALLVVSALLCATGFAFLIYLGPFSVTLTYDFGIVRCIVGFFEGVLIYALYDRMRATSVARTKSQMWGWIAIGSIFAFVAFLSSKQLGYSDLCIYPLAAAVILPVALAPASSATRFLYSRPLQWLGAISYSVYMAHAAVLWFVKGGLRVVTHAQDGVLLPFQEEPLLQTSPLAGTLGMVMGVVLVLLVASLTYTWIEVPFRNWSRLTASNRTPSGDRRTVMASDIAGSSP